jgi:hypothetical protein
LRDESYQTHDAPILELRRRLDNAYPFYGHRLTIPHLVASPASPCLASLAFSYRHVRVFTAVHKDLFVRGPKFHLNLELRLMPLPALEQPNLND